KHIAGGLQKYYPNRRCIIINVDNASTDKTKENFLNADTGPIPRGYISTAAGKKGKGRNFHNLFEYIATVEAEAAVVMDADLTSSKPEWMVKFLQPVLEGGCSFVSPIYKRHPYDGTITNNLCYPITYALNKYDIRQPIGGDFAFDAAMASHWLKENWYECTMQYGIDIFMSTTSVYQGGKIGSTHLGQKAHKPSAPNLLPMFQEVCLSLFNILRDDRDKWENLASDVRQPEKYFPPTGEQSPFPELTVDTGAITLRIEETYEKWGKNMGIFLDGELLTEAVKLIETDDYSLDSEMWVEVLLAALKSYLETSNEKIITGLLPLYFLRQISFIKKTQDMPPEECEKLFHQQAELLRQKAEKLL
ncbi:MAG: glycosyltransferase, partial [bacterium]